MLHHSLDYLGRGGEGRGGEGRGGEGRGGEGRGREGRGGEGTKTTAILQVSTNGCLHYIQAMPSNSATVSPVQTPRQ